MKSQTQCVSTAPLTNCVSFLLRSRDFLTWHFAGNALRPDPASAITLAPETPTATASSTSTTGGARGYGIISVATSDPLGPYQDVGPLLDPSDCPFAIDPHPFRDEDGQWYLFYARDFLDSEAGVRTGTALMVDRLQSMTKLAGKGKSSCARSNWQRFQANRSMYGGIMIGTLRRSQRPPTCRPLLLLLQWRPLETENYGVDGVADSVLGPTDAGNEAGPRAAIHSWLCSGSRSQLCYSRTGSSDRVYCLPCLGTNMEVADVLDRLIWMADGPRCSGPTWTPQTIVSRGDV